jgi:hypothetical protein
MIYLVSQSRHVAPSVAVSSEFIFLGTSWNIVFVADVFSFKFLKWGIGDEHSKVDLAFVGDMF